MNYLCTLMKKNVLRIYYFVTQLSASNFTAIKIPVKTNNIQFRTVTH